MNPFIQNVLAITILIAAIGFLFLKFFWKGKKSAAKNCGEDDCGCH